MMAGIDKHLQIGQAVSLNEQAAGYQITLLPAEQPGAKVVEIGTDYVVFDNEEAGVKTRIPVHLLKFAPPPPPAPQAA
jgi:hypothetical protein